jgi:hypothetical protein
MAQTANAIRTLIYQGKFSFKLKLLKRFSITSSLVGGVGIPTIISLGLTNLPPVGQFAVGGVAMVATFGSTILLQLLTHPYVLSLYELKKPPIEIPSIQITNIDDKIKDTNNEIIDREFIIKSLSVIVLEKETKFRLKDVQVVKEASVHPFASFQVNKKFFYVHSDSILDEQLKRSLTNDF